MEAKLNLRRASSGLRRSGKREEPGFREYVVYIYTESVGGKSILMPMSKGLLPNSEDFRNLRLV